MDDAVPDTPADAPEDAPDDAPDDAPEDAPDDAAAPPPGVTELRLVITVEDHDAGVAFFRDALGLPQVADFSGEQGRVVLLSAGHATIEIADAAQAAYIDEVEVGRRVAGPLRVAFQVTDAPAAVDRLVGAGGRVVAPPTRTPWGSLNARIDGPAGTELTVFEGGD